MMMVSTIDFMVQFPPCRLIEKRTPAKRSASPCIGLPPGRLPPLLLLKLAPAGAKVQMNIPRGRMAPSDGPTDSACGNANERFVIAVNDEKPVELPIDGILDLHAFQPKEVRHLVPDYLELCRERGILEVRIIHGKGTGALQRTVHSILARLPEVVSFRLAGEEEGGWGATIVRLKRPK
jgi:hypothetical protein